MPSRSRKNIRDVITFLNKKIKRDERSNLISFNEFLSKAADEPLVYLRSIFQLFSDMIVFYTKQEDEYKDDPQNISYKTINSDNLLVTETDTPFFADLPLANRLMRLSESFHEGTQQNKIYVFIGPPGSGKSTFLTNLLKKLQEYTSRPEGIYHEVVWKLDDEKLGPPLSSQIHAALEDYYKITSGNIINHKTDILEVPCPNHDHPILMIPKEHRHEVIEQMFTGEEKIKILHKKEYEWIFKNNPCTICSSLYETLQSRLKNPADIFSMIYVRRYVFDRRLARGISVYNPGDSEPEDKVFTNEVIQNELGLRFKNSNLVRYKFSKYSKTNNGVYVLMDVKGNNEKRFDDLHGIISEGTHKIEDIEENINSLFIAVMNPEDKRRIVSKESFKDRIQEISVNYILNYNEEVKIYYHSFGTQIKMKFLPGVLNNFAKIIISSRLNTVSEGLKAWIKRPEQYKKYCDDYLLLLKLSIYNNKIPKWLSDEDYHKFDKKIRRQLIDESENEGRIGFSGRESINIFNEFYNYVKKKISDSRDSKQNMLITMQHIKTFFDKNPDYSKKIPNGFIESLIRLYDFGVLQQMKEALFQKNEERINKDIMNYLFCLNYDMGEKIVSPYTGDNIEVSDNYLQLIENNLYRKKMNETERKLHRNNLAAKFTTVLQEIQVNEEEIENTNLYKELYNSYLKNLRENIFEPLVKFTSFENAVREYGSKKFDVYDDRTKDQVKHLIKNLMSVFNYTLEGSKQISLYVLTEKIYEKFKD